MSHIHFLLQKFSMVVNSDCLLKEKLQFGVSYKRSSVSWELRIILTFPFGLPTPKWSPNSQVVSQLPRCLPASTLSPSFHVVSQLPRGSPYTSQVLPSSPKNASKACYLRSSWNSRHHHSSNMISIKI